MSGWLPLDPKFGFRCAIRVFDTSTGKELRTVERTRGDGVHALALSPDGKYLFSLGREGKLRIEEVTTGVELLRQQFPTDVRASLALSPDGSTVAVASGSLFVWKWRNAEEPRALKTPGYRRGGLAFSPDGQRLTDCSDREATLRLWDVKTGRLLHTLASPDPDVYLYTHAAFAADGKRLAVAGANRHRGTVHLWNPTTGKFLKRLDVGGGALAFSPNGKLLAAGSRIWDFVAGKELSANDAAHRSAIASVVTEPGGVVVTADVDIPSASGRQQPANSGGGSTATAGSVRSPCLPMAVGLSPAVGTTPSTSGTLPRGGSCTRSPEGAGWAGSKPLLSLRTARPCCRGATCICTVGTSAPARPCSSTPFAPPASLSPPRTIRRSSE